MKFERVVGGNAVAQEDENTLAIIHGDQTPDTVHVPHTLPAELGGGREQRVLASRAAWCACGGDHGATHLDLESGVSVAECPARREFLWYRTP